MNPQSPNLFDSEAPGDVLQRAIASHQAETVPAGPPSRLVAATLRALKEVEQTPRSLPPAPRSRMKRYLTTAAGLLLAISACGAFAVLLQTQSTAAFAHMIEPILKAKTARFKITIEFQGLPEQTARVAMSGDGRVRQELQTGQVQIIDSKDGKTLMLNPADKTATSLKMTDSPEPRSANYFDLLRTGLRSAEYDPAVVRESLGKKEIDGREVVGYRVKLNEFNGEMTIWGDPETELPVRAEMKLGMFPNGHYVMTDFEFDVELADSLFEMRVPDGYTLVEQTLSKPVEADLIAGLRLVAEHNEGRFPDAFDLSAMSSLIVIPVLKNPGESAAAQKEQAIKRVQPFTQGLAFAATLPVDANARYAGKEIKLGNADAAIFWYKPAGTSDYRVIHGDLSVSEQSDAPHSPNAVPITFEFSVKKLTDEIMKRHPRPTFPRSALPEPAPADSPRTAPQPALPEPAPATEPHVPKTGPDDPAARQVLDETIKVYANCKSYRDTGVHTDVYHMQSGSTRTTERPFATAFVRPDRFRFEFNDRHHFIKDPAGDRLSRYIIWSNGKEVQTWWDVRPGIEKPESLSLALGSAVGVSGVTSSTIAGLLMPGQLGGGKLSLIRFPRGFTLGEEGQFGEHACYRVVGEWGNSPMTVWIDKQSYLVRRIDTQIQSDKLRGEQTTTYDPVMDVEIADDLLEFNPPAQK